MEQYGWLNIALAPTTFAYPQPVGLQMLPSLAFCITGKLTPIGCNSLAPITASFSLGLAKRRHPQIFEGKQMKNPDVPFLLFCLCSILLYSSVTPASFDQGHWVPDSMECLWL